MRYVLLLICINLACVGTAHAQRSGEGVYAAPGMSVKLQRTPPVPARRSAIASNSVASSLAPRFWQQPDSSKNKSAREFYRLINSHTKYPTTTLRAQVDGKIYVRLTVLPNGEISKADIVRRELNENYAVAIDEGLSTKGKLDLDAEAIKGIQGIRFVAGKTTDTVTVARKFIIQ